MDAVHTRSRSLIDVTRAAVRFDRSPLKDARLALQTSNMIDDEPSMCMDPNPSFEDEILLSPKKGNESGRSLPKKRAFESDPEDDENKLQGIQTRSHNIDLSCSSSQRTKRTKFISTSSATLPAMFARQKQRQPSAPKASKPSSSIDHARECSPPKLHSEPAPLLDLNFVPSSPRKAFLSAPLPLLESLESNGPNGTHSSVMSTSSNPEIQFSSISEKETETTVATDGNMQPPLSSSSPPALDHGELEEVNMNLRPTQTEDGLKKTAVQARNTNSSISEVMPPPVLSAHTLQNILHTPVTQTRARKNGHHSGISSSFPMSPLTPLPPTPATALKRKLSDLSTQSIGNSPIETYESNVPRKKSLVPGPRMTRAATLRQQKVQQNRLALHCQSTMNPDTDDGPKLRGPNPGKTLTSSTAASRARSVTRADIESSINPHESSTCPPSESPRKEKCAPSLPSFTFSSTLCHNTSKQPDILSTSPSRKSFKLTLPSSLGGPQSLNFSPKKGASGPAGQTALSALSRALAKLAVPPPSKPRAQSQPSTSQGSNREPCESVSDPSKARMPPPFPPPPLSMAARGNTTEKRSRIQKANPGVLSSLSSGACSQTRGAGSSSRMLRGSNPFSRPLQKLQDVGRKASKVTTLETIKGSPVKGISSPPSADGDDDNQPIFEETKSPGSSTSKATGATSSSDPIQSPDDIKWNLTSIKSKSLTCASSSSSEPMETTTASDSTSEKGLKQISKLNASRRASMAFSALERSIREQGIGLKRPSLSPGILQVGKRSNESMSSCKEQSAVLSGDRQRSTSAPFTTSSGRAVRQPSQFRSFTTAVVSDPSLPSDIPGRSKSQSSVPLDSLNGRTIQSQSEFDFDTQSSDVKQDTGGVHRKRPKKMPGSLSILEGCTIFVDVRTEEGEDASALFVDMLQGLGAKILTRGVGQTCTHVVYKNGLPSTIGKVRLMDAESRPHVVGIAWVVECAEKREVVDESSFAIEIDGLHVAGSSKRRKSVMPQPMAITAGTIDAFMEFSRLNKKGSHSGNKKDTSIGLKMSNESTDVRAKIITEGLTSSIPSKLTPLEVARLRRTSSLM